MGEELRPHAQLQGLDFVGPPARQAVAVARCRIARLAVRLDHGSRRRAVPARVQVATGSSPGCVTGSWARMSGPSCTGTFAKARATLLNEGPLLSFVVSGAKRRKTRMDQGTRKRLPALPVLVTTAIVGGAAAADLLQAAKNIEPESWFRDIASRAAEHPATRQSPSTSGSAPSPAPGNMTAHDC